LPVNATDAVTMLHDIDYLRFAENDILTQMADRKAISNAGFDLPGIATKIGLTIRKNFFNESFNKRLPGKTVQETHQIGQDLLEAVRQNPKFVKRFKDFNVEL
jgi:hypothetical protein